MPSLSEPKQRRHLLGSGRSIRRLLERRWLVVVLALALTGLGAAITGLLFTSGINLSGGSTMQIFVKTLTGDSYY